MALGGNPIFNGKNFRGATQAPPVPQAPYGQAPYGRAPAMDLDGQAGYGQQTSEQLQYIYDQPCRGSRRHWPDDL